MPSALDHNGLVRNDQEGHPAGIFTFRGEYPEGLPDKVLREVLSHPCTHTARLQDFQITYTLDLVVGQHLSPVLRDVLRVGKDHEATLEDVTRARGLLLRAVNDCVRTSLRTPAATSSN